MTPLEAAPLVAAPLVAACPESVRSVEEPPATEADCPRKAAYGDHPMIQVVEEVEVVVGLVWRSSRPFVMRDRQ